MLERQADGRQQVAMLCLEDLVPGEHLLRKIEKAVDWKEIYPMVEQYYCEDNGRPAIDPVVLVKMAMIQHIFGIRSLRQTRKEIEVNLAYRWFLGFGVDTPIPHFATISYAFATRFPSEVCEKIFAWILDAAVAKKRISNGTVITTVTLLKGLRGFFARPAVGVWRFFGFARKREFDADGFREFLSEIGLPPCRFEIIDGNMPMAVAVWRKTQT